MPNPQLLETILFPPPVWHDLGTRVLLLQPLPVYWSRLFYLALSQQDARAVLGATSIAFEFYGIGMDGKMQTTMLTEFLEAQAKVDADHSKHVNEYLEQASFPEARKGSTLASFFGSVCEAWGASFHDLARGHTLGQLMVLVGESNADQKKDSQSSPPNENTKRVKLPKDWKNLSMEEYKTQVANPFSIT